jgi:hypothetical protein
MAHYAFLDKTNKVVQVIVGIDETEQIEGLDPETWYGNYKKQKCIRTSYNADTNGFRFNFAGIGYTYDPDSDAFIVPKPKCGHKELFLNDKFKWNCQGCELEAKKLDELS